jgi:hypothetical protein
MSPYEPDPWVALEDLPKPYAVKVACTDSSGGVACKGGLYRDMLLPIFILTFDILGWFDLMQASERFQFSSENFSHRARGIFYKNPAVNFIQKFSQNSVPEFWENFWNWHRQFHKFSYMSWNLIQFTNNRPKGGYFGKSMPPDVRGTSGDTVTSNPSTNGTWRWHDGAKLLNFCFDDARVSLSTPGRL